MSDSIYEHKALIQALARLNSLADTSSMFGGQIEKFRWDIPVVTLVWRYPLSGKSIDVLLITGENPQEPDKVEVSINAWKDDIDTATRHWQYQVVGSCPSDYRSTIDNLIESAYQIVSNWTRADLKTQAPIDQKTLAFLVSEL